LKRAAIEGALWSISSNVVGSGARVVYNVILAKLLFPEAFGLMALVTIFLQGLKMFSDIGIGPAVIQNQRDDPRLLDSAWTIQVVRGIVLWIACCAIAWPVASIYQQAALVWLLPACGVTTIIQGLASTSFFTLARNLDFKKVAVYTTLTTIAEYAITVVLAWLGFGLWSLVFGWYSGSGIRTIVSHAINPGARHRFCWDRECIRAVARFGRWIFVSTLITFFARQLDRLLLGGLVPLSTVGVYTIALSVVSMPMQIAQRLNESILFPVFASRSRENSSRLGADLLRARAVVLSIAMVSLLGAAFFLPVFIESFYDARYASAAWMGQVLTLYVWFSVLQASSDRALLALGEARPLAYSNATNAASTLLGCFVGYRLGGITGFCMGVTGSSLAGHAVIQYALAKRGIGIVRQDIVYTGIGLLTGIIGIGILQSGGMREHLRVHEFQRCALGAVSLAPVGLWALRVVIRESKPKTRKGQESRFGCSLGGFL
jgi:O-antigen/teichoic acid export membrane protein